MLGSNIKIGAGAKVIGGVTVGDGARIGANAVVMRNVAPGTTFNGLSAAKPALLLARVRTTRGGRRRVALAELSEARARRRG